MGTESTVLVGSTNRLSSTAAVTDDESEPIRGRGYRIFGAPLVHSRDQVALRVVDLHADVARLTSDDEVVVAAGSDVESWVTRDHPGLMEVRGVPAHDLPLYPCRDDLAAVWGD